jgi:demethylmenaquinone methyltransferase/2-methoxy-6-polyprenyl-1,4-benzoquinol methylase
MTDPSRSPRQADVRAMFDRIAGSYRRMNALMTFGRDRAWRRAVVREASLPPGGRLLDLASGTGDIALEALRRDPFARVTAADFSLGMMRVGRGRRGGDRIAWCAADAFSLPFADARFDAVTSGYLLRNVADRVGAFREQARVVRPGGKVVCLDTSPPPPSLLGAFVRFYLRRVIPLLGRLVAGDRPAYAYLAASTEGFKTPAELAAIMREAGLVDVRHCSFMGGSIAVHTGTRPSAAKAGG